MPQNSKSQDSNNPEQSKQIQSTVQNTTGRPILKEKRLELLPLEDDHPLWTAGFVVGVKLLNPSSRKPSKPEAELIPEQQIEDE